MYAHTYVRAHVCTPRAGKYCAGSARFIYHFFLPLFYGTFGNDVQYIRPESAGILCRAELRVGIATPRRFSSRP